MMSEPEFTNWKDAWEARASAETARYVAQSEDRLIADLEAGLPDAYYSRWTGFRHNGTLARSGPVLLGFLRRATGPDLELERYHAAGALFHLLGFPDDPLPELRTRAQWAIDRFGGEAGRQRALDEVAGLLAARGAGGPPA